MKIVIIIPTYNEVENIGLLIDRLQEEFIRIPHQMQILVVDDQSPDGTAHVVSHRMSRFANVHQISGPKAGLGTAYIRGMTFALDALHADAVMEMDADFSHKPEDVGRLVAALDNGWDFVIGSRYVAGGRIPADWALWRVVVSKWGNFVARRIAGMNRIQDCTAGFRAIRSQVIRKIGIRDLTVQGYAFQVVLLYRALQIDARIKEIPVEFVDRVLGQTKLGVADIVEFILNSLKIRMMAGKRFLIASKNKMFLIPGS